jgi:hypothetical protein
MNPSVPQPGLSTKLGLLWATNKPLFIAAVAGILLLIAAIVFLIVFFLVIRPANAAATPVKAQTITPNNVDTSTTPITPKASTDSAKSNATKDNASTPSSSTPSKTTPA